MKISIVLFIAVCLSLSAVASKKLPGTAPAKSKMVNNKGFAVIELFTSEGCSSCPPADELIARIQKETNQQPVYILAFHVDYWNRLGWKDVFSSHAFSERQNQYAKWLNLQSIYTPQVVVNGKKEFVGSEDGTLHNALKTALQKSSVIQLNIKDLKASTNKVSLQYHIDGSAAGTSLILALVQKSGVSHVQSGENKGLTLAHVQIVRNISTLAIDRKNDGVDSIVIPAGLNKQSLELIAFIQNNHTGEILAADKSAINL